MKLLRVSKYFSLLIWVIAIGLIFVPCLPVGYQRIYAAAGSSNLPNLDAQSPVSRFSQSPPDNTSETSVYIATVGCSAVFDTDNDSKSEIGIYSNGTWSMLKSSQNYSVGQFISWGVGDAEVLYGDFDGDRKMDPGYIVPEAGGQSAVYAILKSTADYAYPQALFVPAGWSSLGDRSVVGDFDGDGKADPSIWRLESEGHSSGRHRPRSTQRCWV